MQSQKNFIANLGLAMERRGLNQRDVAKLAQTSFVQVNRILKAKSVPTLLAAERLANVFKVSLSAMLDEPETFQKKILRKIPA